MSRLNTNAFVILKIVILAILLNLSGVSFAVSHINYHSVNYSVKDGLTQNSVLSIAMDSRNILWVGTRIGLNSYNGKEFRHIISASYPDFNNKAITNIAVDDDDNIWCHVGKNLYSYSYLEDSVRLYDGEFTSLYGAGGKIYATRENKVMQFNKDTDGFDDLFSVVHWMKVRAADNDYLYALTNHEIVMYDFRSKQVMKVEYPDGKCQKEQIQLYSDGRGRLWITNYNGKCYVMDVDGKTLEAFNDDKLDSFIGGQYSRMAGKDNIIYFTSVFNGVLAYDTDRRQIVGRMFNSVGYPSSISHNNIQSLFIDRMSGLWIGSFSGGLDYVNLSDGGVSAYHNVKDMPGTLGTVGCLAEFDDAIYAGTEGGLVRVDKSSGIAEYEHINLPMLNNAGFKCLVKYDDSRLIIAPYMRGIHVYDVRRKQVVSSINELPFDDIKQILPDLENGKIWLAALGGIAYIDIMTNNVHEIEGLPEGLLVNCATVSPEGDIYFGTRNNGIVVCESKTGRCTVYNKNKLPWLVSGYITSILWSKTGNLWISTYGRGVMKCELEEGNLVKISDVKVYDNNVGLVNDYVVGMVEDGNRSVWCVTLGGLSRISLQGIVKNYSGQNVCDFTEPTIGGVMIDDEQSVWIGANNGIYTFPAMGMRNNLYVPNMEFCNITINGLDSRKLEINRVIRNKDINSFKLDIDYDNFPLDIEFNAINYNNNAGNRYKYRILGVSSEWIDLKNNNNLNIAGLSPGKYTLQLMGANNDGIWNDKPLEMQISVAPPIWQTWWAYMIYVLAIAALFLNYIRKVKQRQQRKHELMLEKELRKNQEKLNEEKLQFYTNFSHEMRTPLTLIMGPIEELAGKVEDKKQAKILNMAKDNCKRLMYLVNQLLDFRKMEDGSLSLHYTLRTPAVMVRKVCDTFVVSAKKRNISLNMNLDESFTVEYDSFLIETVVFNLLSNAFKFTPDNGEINVTLSCIDFSTIGQKYAERFECEHQPSDKMMRLSVKDTGKGVPQEEVEKIFARFYQLDGDGALMRGSGLGLNFCKEIAIQHKGIIYVESKEGEGAEFVFIIPCFVSGVEAEAVVETENIDEVNYEDNAISDEPVTEEEKLRILFVEDNCDISDFVAEGLSDIYIVDTASDGVQALEMLNERSYNVVISDVMMPRMIGLELCRHIKNDLETSHIPVILLTARTAEEHKMEGYDSHADDYICKPFSMSLLKAAIRNVLWKMARYGNMVTMDTKEMTITNAQSLDDKFMNAFYKFIDDNISNAELNNDVISREMGIGRTQLNSKIKALTMSTPAKLVYKRRLYRAKLMIEQGAGFVSDIAYDCGFSDPIYFSRCFKKEYGISPTDYIKNREVK